MVCTLHYNSVHADELSKFDKLIRKTFFIYIIIVINFIIKVLFFLCYHLLYYHQLCNKNYKIRFDVSEYLFIRSIFFFTNFYHSFWLILDVIFYKINWINK